MESDDESRASFAMDDSGRATRDNEPPSIGRLATPLPNRIARGSGVTGTRHAIGLAYLCKTDAPTRLWQASACACQKRGRLRGWTATRPG